jgi:hypothetical protein
LRQLGRVVEGADLVLIGVYSAFSARTNRLFMALQH